MTGGLRGQYFLFHSWDDLVQISFSHCCGGEKMSTTDLLLELFQDFRFKTNSSWDPFSERLFQGVIYEMRQSVICCSSSLGDFDLSRVAILEKKKKAYSDFRHRLLFFLNHLRIKFRSCNQALLHFLQSVGKVK